MSKTDKEISELWKQVDAKHLQIAVESDRAARIREEHSKIERELEQHLLSLRNEAFDLYAKIMKRAK